MDRDAHKGARLGERPDFKEWVKDVAAAVEARRGVRRRSRLQRALARVAGRNAP